jgi:Zn-dependent peptidase ImmA (M78 family)
MSSPTRSENYFLDLFKSATLQGAIEKAAETTRGQRREGPDSIPVDVFRIATDKQVRVSNDLVGNSCEEGLLIPLKGGYRVRLKKNSTESRRRFSLAHELGHTLFYRDSGSGPRHQIGVLNTRERTAEERICNLFASALLMPSQQLRKHLGNLPTDRPSQLLDRLEVTARHFRVSLPALFQRLRSIEIDGPSYLLVCLTSRPNPATRADTTLRVDTCVSVGPHCTVCIWRNRSAGRVGLRGALSLYDKWQEVSRKTKTKGSFSLDPEFGLVTAQSKNVDSEETIVLSRAAHGKWANETSRAISSSRLYAWTADEEQSAYVISALTLTPVSGDCSWPPINSAPRASSATVRSI